ncbi:MAG: hypothetical protein ACOX7R_11330 [Acetivibrionales bacterium]
MTIFINTVRSMFRRPLIVIFWSVLMLIYFFIDMSVSKIVNHFIQADEGSFFEGIIHLLQLVFNFVTKPGTFPLIVFYFLIFVFMASVPTGLVLSGYLNIVNGAVTAKQQSGGEFFGGIGKYFFRIWFITFRVLLFGLIFIIFALVASVPAIIITKAAVEGNSGMTAAAMFVDILTVCVLFFGSVFFRTYAFFWYPVAMDGHKRAFSTAKKLVDVNFWKLVIRFAVFDIIYILFLTIMMNIGSLPLRFAVNWVFASLYFSFFITYIFATYRVIKASKKAY